MLHVAVPDMRARTLLEDLRATDPLAREIVDRVDRGAYGTRGRRNAAMEASGDEDRGSGQGQGQKGGAASSSKSGAGSGAGKVGGWMGGPPASVQGRGRMVGLGQEMQEMGGLANAQ